MNSCLYEGVVRHRRFHPIPHAFRYKLFMLYLDLDELPGLFRGRWLWSGGRPNVAWFRRADHLGDAALPLDRALRDLVESRSGRRPRGPVRLLTHLRYFGYGFNPVSFYFCFDRADQAVETIVAEVNNTPWGEQHCYVLDQPVIPAGRTKRYHFDKAFHVSPFMDMDLAYDWQFSEPGRSLGVHMQTMMDGRLGFDATMSLRRTAMDGRALARVLLQYPLMTGQVIAAIYGQALRLWWKGAPFFSHPRKRQASHLRRAAHE